MEVDPVSQMTELDRALVECLRLFARRGRELREQQKTAEASSNPGRESETSAVTSTPSENEDAT
jgi:hypothetical protein